MLLTSLLPVLATKESRVLEKKVNETQISKTVFGHLKQVEFQPDAVIEFHLLYHFVCYFFESTTKFNTQIVFEKKNLLSFVLYLCTKTARLILRKKIDFARYQHDRNR